MISVTKNSKEYNNIKVTQKNKPTTNSNSQCIPHDCAGFKHTMDILKTNEGLQAGDL